jgi:hypothetical protein
MLLVLDWDVAVLTGITQRRDLSGTHRLRHTRGGRVAQRAESDGDTVPTQEDEAYQHKEATSDQLLRASES